MNDNFKTELAEFARDVNAMCDANPDTCEHCPLIDMDDGYCKAGFLNSCFDAEAAIAAVEAYRKRKKPCAEVIDRTLDVYNIEVKITRSTPPKNWTAKDGAQYAVDYLRRGYCTDDCATVRVLSAKRYVLESHREEE